MTGRGLAVGLRLLALLIIAGITHIVSVLCLPYVAPDNALSRIARTAPEATVSVLPPAARAGEIVPGRDPGLATAICRFDLRHGPLRIAMPVGNARFAALSLHGRSGRVFYGLNDRSGSEGKLEVVVLTSQQMSEAIANDPPDAPVRDVRVLAPERTGYAAFDVLPRFGDYEAAVRALGSVQCEVERQS